MGDMIVKEQAGSLLTESDMIDLRGMMQQMTDAMGAMAAMISATNERMGAMERKISALER